MGTSFLLFEQYLYVYQCPPREHSPDWDEYSFEFKDHWEPCHDPDNRNEPDWADEPKTNLILYSVVTTIICCFGILGNTLSLMVLRRKEFVGSVYTYLAVLAATDLALSITYFLGGLAHGVFHSTSWGAYDVLIGLPLGGAINSMGVLATAGLTIDRVLFLWNPVQCVKPKFCNPKIARALMASGAVLSVLLNIPYCFIFTLKFDGTLAQSDFYFSRLYASYNWFMLIIFTIIPGLILILGNGMLILSLHKARQIRSRCTGKIKRDNKNLTIILISIIVLFILAEIPSNLISKTRAVTLIYFGEYADDENSVVDIIRVICTLLGAFNVAVNFLFYYLFCPTFYRALKKMFRGGTSKKTEKVHVNFIVLNENLNMKHMKAKVIEITKSLNAPLYKVDEKKGDDVQNCCSEQMDSEYIEVIDEYKGNGFLSGSSSQPLGYDNASEVTIIKDGYK
ncbi:somatostatin receptor type 1 [Diorhabda carinulata]|uniref:somatostatin receptor type 1 n=1 Tax=Diorhabda carinulata TaxID=1163345 RepID=UPI0025A214E6|nr:somatostatin receptor type 1 [Diorhabda carinulata]